MVYFLQIVTWMESCFIGTHTTFSYISNYDITRTQTRLLSKPPYHDDPCGSHGLKHTQQKSALQF